VLETVDLGLPQPHFTSHLTEINADLRLLSFLFFWHSCIQAWLQSHCLYTQLLTHKSGEASDLCTQLLTISRARWAPLGGLALAWLTVLIGWVLKDSLVS
jgi:hypothetical protein